VPTEQSLSVEDIDRRVKSWMADNATASIKTPSGWFGRPRDNRHSLTWSVARGSRLLLEFDERQLLVLDAPNEVTESADDLSIGGFRTLIFNWLEYGSEISHTEVCESGRLSLIANFP